MLSRKFFHLLTLALLLAAMFVVTPQAVQAECGVYHTVVRGQNLFRISLRYGVTIEAIAAANGIADVRRIYAGQVLYIPCAGGTTPTTPTTTYPTYPTTPTYPGTTYPGTTYPGTTFPGTTFPVTGSSGVVTAPVFGAVDCSGFRATSPLDGFRDGTETFYWDAPRSINSVAIYQVVILDDAGRRVAAFSTAGGITRVLGDVSFNAIGGRSRFSWYVSALVNGNETCRTQTTVVNRQWNPFAGLSS